MRAIYINGAFIDEKEAQISIFDRGFLFSDAVYEVTAVLDGNLVDNARHLDRLFRSLSEVGITFDLSHYELEVAQRELVNRNNVCEGVVYLQVTRGVAERDFLWPTDIAPTVIMFTQTKNLTSPALAERGAKVITVEDIRWGRRDIKTTSLLAQALAKNAAREEGCDDAWMVEDNLVTEGSSTNAFIVTPSGVLKTRDLSIQILHGITRRAVLEIAEEFGMDVTEEAFSVEEALTAAEAFATGSSFFVLPVVEIDGTVIGNGIPGDLTRRIRERYLAIAKASISASDKIQSI